MALRSVDTNYLTIMAFQRTRKSLSGNFIAANDFQWVSEQQQCPRHRVTIGRMKLLAMYA